MGPDVFGVIGGGLARGPIVLISGRDIGAHPQGPIGPTEKVMFLIYLASGFSRGDNPYEVDVEVTPLAVAPTLGEAEATAEAFRATARARKARRREIVEALVEALVAERGPMPHVDRDRHGWSSWCRARDERIDAAYAAEGLSRCVYRPEGIRIQAFEATPEVYL